MPATQGRADPSEAGCRVQPVAWAIRRRRARQVTDRLREQLSLRPRLVWWRTGAERAPGLAFCV
jgi:hypothetical protein